METNHNLVPFRDIPGLNLQRGKMIVNWECSCGALFDTVFTGSISSFLITIILRDNMESLIKFMRMAYKALAQHHVADNTNLLNVSNIYYV